MLLAAAANVCGLPVSFRIKENAVSPAAATETRPGSPDTLDVELGLDLLEDSDELLVEEISIDGMCGVY